MSVRWNSLAAINKVPFGLPNSSALYLFVIVEATLLGLQGVYIVASALGEDLAGDVPRFWGAEFCLYFPGYRTCKVPLTFASGHVEECSIR